MLQPPLPSPPVGAPHQLPPLGILHPKTLNQIPSGHNLSAYFDLLEERSCADLHHVFDDLFDSVSEGVASPREHSDIRGRELQFSISPLIQMFRPIQDLPGFLNTNPQQHCACVVFVPRSCEGRAC